MGPSHALARGASFALFAQLTIAVGQFVYSGVTSRAFSPSIFGSYAVALSLQSVLMVLASSGIPALIFRIPTLVRYDRRTVRSYAICLGGLGALTYALVAPAWYTITGSPGSQEFAALLAASLLVHPLAMTESSIMRRLGSPHFDAGTLLAAFLTSSLIAGTGVVWSGSALWLAAAPLLNSSILLCISSVVLVVFLRSEMRAATGDAQRSSFSGVRFVSAVAGQNLFFQVLYQAPTWTIGIAAGPTAVGLFARSQTLTNLPSGALATAFLRLLQPVWRSVRRRRQTLHAMQDVLLITSSASTTLFFTLAAVVPSLVPIWLGAGWDSAIVPAQILAVSAGLYVPYSVHVSALEVQGRLSLVRGAQLLYLAMIVVGLAAFLLLGELWCAAAAVLLAQTCSLGYLLLATSKRVVGTSKGLLGYVAIPALWAVPPAVSATLVSAAVAQQPTSFVAQFTTLSLGTASAIACWLLLVRWQPSLLALDRRGVQLPRILTWRPF